MNRIILYTYVFCSYILLNNFQTKSVQPYLLLCELRETFKDQFYLLISEASKEASRQDNVLRAIKIREGLVVCIMDYD